MRLLRLATIALIIRLALAPVATEGQAPRAHPTVAVVFANQPTRDLVGPQPSDPYARAFLEGMRDLGWVDGQNVTIVWRSAEGQPDRSTALANELVRLKVDVIVASGAPALGIRSATSAIPIVVVGADAVHGIQSLARPGGNVTGLTTSSDARFAEKRLELLKETVPKISRVAYLSDVGASAAPQAAARALRLTLVPIPVKDPDGLQPALASLARQRVDAIFVAYGRLFWTQRREIIEFAAQQRLPAMYPYDVFVRDGGLISYGVNFVDLLRRAASYVDKILKGAKPGDLPVEQPLKFELLVNLKTAKALGLAIPETILLQADRTIE
jgi:putative ABC transport system substrate-binding protein